MIQKDPSASAPTNATKGISYTGFSYMILQSYD